MTPRAARARTIAGALTFVLLSLAAMAGIAAFANHASRQNASALLYEAAVTQLQVLMRGLNEAVVTEGALASLTVVADGVTRFESLRQASPELTADTAATWPEPGRGIADLMRNRRNIPFDDTSLIALGRVTGGVERLAARLNAQAVAKRESAVAAESRIQFSIVAAGLLLILGSVTVLVMHDRTAQRILDTVRASESQLREITDALPVLVSYLDAERRFRFQNQAVQDTLGLAFGQIDGHTMLEVFGAEMYESLRPRVDAVLAGTPVHFEHLKTNARGEVRDHAVHYFPRRARGGRVEPVIGFYALVTDVTESKRIERMKAEFVATVSHELRTPLTSIRGSLGLLAGGVAGEIPDAAKKLIDIARSNCERLIRLVSDILDTEKLEAGLMPFNLQRLDLRPLLDQTVAANEGFAAHHHEVRLAFSAAPEALRADVDPDRFVQIVTNLLSNAIKFSPRHGVVDLALSRRAGYARIEVRDRGPGIPEEFRARVFNKFSQADASDTREKAGTGLGLSISKALVERLGGTIGFTTATGVGTTFFFELPEAGQAQGPTQAAHAPARPSILVCEHDAGIGRLLGMILDNAGYDSELAASPSRARELLGGRKYAALTVDLKLPSQGGIAVTRALCEEALMHGLPIVTVSALTEGARVRINGEILSVDEWLEQPAADNRMVAAIRREATAAL